MLLCVIVTRGRFPPILPPMLPVLDMTREIDFGIGFFVGSSWLDSLTRRKAIWFASVGLVYVCRPLSKLGRAQTLWHSSSSGEQSQLWFYSSLRSFPSFCAVATVIKHLVQIESQEPSGLCRCKFYRSVSSHPVALRTVLRTNCRGNPLFLKHRPNKVTSASVNASSTASITALGLKARRMPNGTMGHYLESQG